MIHDRTALVEFAQKSIQKGSKSFAFVSQIFEPNMRDKVMLFYAWCRKCDDIVDGQNHGHNIDNIESMSEVRSRKLARERIDIIRAKTSMALSGEATNDPAFDALAILINECPIERKYIDDIINGFALDAEEWRPRNEDDLYQYCYHVAGAVGIIMAQIMGISENNIETLDRASDLGIAFQLANISRDIGEDDKIGRCYLPIDWLVEMDIEPGQHMRPHYRPALVKLAARLCHKSQAYNLSARYGAQSLHWRAQWAILSASSIYGDIAYKVIEAGEQAWDQRLYSNKVEKLYNLGESLLATQKPLQPVSRKGLWTHPK